MTSDGEAAVVARHQHTQQDDSARDAFAAGNKLSPRKARALYSLGVVARLDGKLDEAVANATMGRAKGALPT